MLSTEVPRALLSCLTMALAVLAAACLDFDQYGEDGAGGSGAVSAGGAGGAGGSSATCPSDDMVPASVCILGAPYLFDADFNDDWARTESGIVGDSDCPDSCASLELGASRIDLRTVMTGVASDCFISIDVLASNAQRTFLELIPDDGTTGSPIPPPDRANNIEVAVVDNTVRFEVAAEMIPALTLAEGVVVDRLRIQVRADTVVLEAFAAGERVACTEQERPDLLLSEPLRAGFGIQGSAGQDAMFDNFGVD